MRTFLISLFFILMVSGTGMSVAPKHTVQAGETLFRISQKYGVTVAQLQEWNQLSGTIISVGQELIVGKRSDSKVEKEHSEGEVRHTVRPGETLFRISQKYGVSVSDIRRWNQLEGDTIHVGQELRLFPEGVTEEPAQVPELPDEPEGPAVVSEEPEEKEEDIPLGHYEVRPGDTLYRIAKENNMTVEELMRINHLESSMISIGQTLRIRSLPPAPPSVATEWEDKLTPQGAFVTYTIQNGVEMDTLLSLYQMDEAEFRALNPGLKPADLREGDEVTLLLPASTKRANPYRKSFEVREGAEIPVTKYPGSTIGKATTSGDLYHPGVLTGAHPGIVLGSVVFVKNPETGRGIFVYINDRTTGNRLVLSEAAFEALGYDTSSRHYAIIDREAVK